MTTKFAKYTYLIFATIFIVGFASVGIAALFDKSVVKKAVKTITETVYKEEDQSTTTPTPSPAATSNSSTGTSASSGSNSAGGSSATGGGTQPTPTKTTLTTAVVASHNSTSNCWIILSGSVYNISSYQHSGGASHIACGTDQTNALASKHGLGYLSFFSSYLVGALGSQI